MNSDDARKASAKTLASVSDLARITASDKGRTARILEAAGIAYEPGLRASHLYPIFLAVRAIIDAKAGISSADRRNLADAELKELQAARLRRDSIPIEEARALGARMASITSDAIEGSALSFEAQNELNDRLREAVGAAFAE